MGCVSIEAVAALIQDPCLVLDDEYVIQAANAAFYRAFQRASSKTIGQSLAALNDPYWDLAHLCSRLKEDLPSNEQGIELVFRARTEHPVRGLLCVNACRVGSPPAILLTLREEQLQDAAAKPTAQVEQIFQAILDKDADLVAALDTDYCFLAFNRAYRDEFQRIFGVTIQRGMNLFDALAHLPEEQENARAIWGRALGGEEFVIVQGFGGVRREHHYYEVAYRALYDDQGEQCGAVHYVRNVTAQHRAEQERNQLFELSQDLFCIADDAGHFKQINPAWERVLGYTQEEFLATPMQSFIHPDDLANTEVVAAQLSSGQPVYHFENRYRHKDGSYRWLSWMAAPMLQQGSVYATARDITEQKTAEAALKASESLLSSVLESSLDGVMAFRSVRNDAGQIIDFEWLLANPRAKEWIGRSSETLIGQRLLAQMPGTRTTGQFDVYARVVESGEPATHEFYYDHGGTRRWFQNTVVKLGDGLAVTFRDVTREREVEEMRLAMTTAKMGTWELNLETYEVKRSISTDELFGLPADGAIRTLDAYLDRIHPDDRGRFQETLARAIEEKIPHMVEYRIVLPDGGVRWVSSRGTVVLDEAGNAIRKVGALTDITEQKKTEEALRLAEERFRIALQNSPIVVFNQDLDLRYTWIYNNPSSNTPTANRELDSNEAIWDRRDADVIAYPEETKVLEALKRRALASNEMVRQEIEISEWNNDSPRTYDLTLEPLRNSDGEIIGLTGAAIDITEHKEIKAALEARARQQAAIAELGQQALTGMDLDLFMQNVVSLVAATLDVEYCNVLELLPEGDRLMLRAGVGWKPAYTVGDVTVSADLNSQAGYTLLSNEPVVIENLRQESRFSGGPLLYDHGVVSGMSVVIGGRERIYGVLGAYTTRQHSFSRDEVTFLRSLANKLTMVIERRRVEMEQVRLLAEVRAAHVATEQARQQIEELAGERARHLAQLRAIFSSISEGLVIADLEGNLLEMNPAGLALHGFTQLEEAQIHLLDYAAHFELFTLKGEQLKVEAWPLARALHEETFSDQEVRVRDKRTGKEWIGSYSGTPVYEGDGHLIFAILTVRDVTEQKEAERALQVSEERLRLAIEAGAIGIWDIDLHENRRTWSDRAKAIYGLQPGEPFDDYEQQLARIHPEDRAQVHQAIHEFRDLALRDKLELQHRIVWPDGTVHWVSVRGEASYEGEGSDRRTTRLVGTIIDVTEQVEAEEALRKSETRFRVMAETLPDILFTCQPNGAIDYINKRFSDYTGIEPDEALGLKWTNVLHADDIERHRQEWWRALAAGLTFENEFRIRTAAGHYRWFVGRAHPIHDDQGQIARWIGTCTDIHDQKMAEEALRYSEQQLRLFNETLEERVQQRTRQVRELASALTLAEQRERRRISQVLHDHVQQMLYGIQMRNHLLKLDAELEEQPALGAHIQVMNELVEQAIRSTRSLSVELSPPVLKNEGLAAAFEWLAGNMREVHGLTVETHLLDDYQPASEDLRVLIFQVTRELLFNVVKHANVDQARLEMYEKGHNLVVRIIDEGNGFDVQNESNAGSPEGGFGLYSIQERLALFGGHLVIESTLNKGTVATVVVPRQPTMPFWSHQSVKSG